MRKTIIETKGISKIFNVRQVNESRVLDDISFSIREKSITLLRGPSGSGKTTLLTILGCLAKPTAGSCSILDQNVSRWSEKFLTEFRRDHIGLIFQNFNLIAGLNVFENIMLPLIPLKLSDREIESKVENAMRMMKIAHCAEHSVNILSGGEMQRTSIARALVNDPQIILADEPTAHLDTELASEILSSFNTLKNEGRTIVIATHDPLVETKLSVDHIICLRDGRLRESHAC